MLNDQSYTTGDIIIGNDAWMGYEVTIIPGAKIATVRLLEQEPSLPRKWRYM
jgi:hypothetical protein